jgi:hypothetical protein
MNPAAPPVFRRGGRLLALVLLCPFLVLAGCRVDARVTLSVEGRGGEVGVRFEADREAVAILGSPRVITHGAQAADLRRAGWEVGEPRKTRAGAAVVYASKRFSRPADLAPLIEELAGPEGPLQGFRLDRDRGLTRVRYLLSGGMYLGSTGELLTGFGNDPGLAPRLQAAGVDPGRVAALLTQRGVEGLHLSVVVDLPGRDPVRFEARPGEAGEVRVSASEPDRTRPLLLVLAGVLAVAALAVLWPRAHTEPGRSGG